jgi:peroxiredoxin
MTPSDPQFPRFPEMGTSTGATRQPRPVRSARLGRVVGAALAACTIAVLAWALLTPGRTAPGTGSPSGTPLPPAPQVGHLAPNVTLLDLSGHPIDVASLRGKVVILNFWYVACEPCRYEMPLLERVYHADQDRGLAVIGLNMADDAPTITTYVERLGVDYPVLRDQNQRAVLAYQITSTPISFVIDRQGVIRARLVGAITDTAKLNAALAPLLAAR